jgi:hypothetical protein
MIEEIVFSETLKIYKAKYNWEFSQEDINERVQQNWSVVGLTDNNTSLFLIQSNELNSIKKYVLTLCAQLSNIDLNSLKSWAQQVWIYQSDTRSKPENGSKTRETFHDHPTCLTHPKTYKNIETSWTCCFYLKVPKNLKGDDGKLVFQDVDKTEYSILPEEGDFIIFSKDVKHRPNSIPSVLGQRISICSNIGFNIDEFKIKKSVI